MPVQYFNTNVFLELSIIHKYILKEHYKSLRCLLPSVVHLRKTQKRIDDFRVAFHRRKSTTAGNGVGGLLVALAKLCYQPGRQFVRTRAGIWILPQNQATGLG